MLSSNMEFCTDGMVYTSKHLHVSTPQPTASVDDVGIGVKRKASHINEDNAIEDLAKSSWSTEDSSRFVEQGFIVKKSMIPDSLIMKCRQYIDQCWDLWMSEARRPDDWRFHFMLDTHSSTLNQDNDPILRLFTQSASLQQNLRSILGDIGGVFYTQVAIRTPILPPADVDGRSKSKRRKCVDTISCQRFHDLKKRTDYHIDGQANVTGSRFPDLWTVLVGIALNDQVLDDCGNFTVYPGSHTVRKWHDYPEQKILSGKRRENASCNIYVNDNMCDCVECRSHQLHCLPDIGKPVELKLNRGDVVIAHVLLAHKGGRNTCGGDIAVSANDNDFVKNIPKGSREIVFFRVQKKYLDYKDPGRSLSVLDDPWCEFLDINVVIKPPT